MELCGTLKVVHRFLHTEMVDPSKKVLENVMARQSTVVSLMLDGSEIGVSSTIDCIRVRGYASPL